jgi:hypothetical protein
MPKKTKKQKMLADLRRVTHHPSTEVTSSPRTPDTQSAFTFRLTGLDTKHPSAVPAEDKQELIVIKRDLFYTIVLAAMAIAIELGVYYLLRGL